MNEFKFACPVCGQHITCAVIAAGLPMSCPTCFRTIVVPPAPENHDSKLVRTATEAGRPSKPGLPRMGTTEPARPKGFPFAVAGLAVVGLIVVVGAVVFRAELAHFIRRTLPEGHSTGTVEAKPAEDPHWTLDLTGRKIPEGPVVGRIRGRDFSLTRATVQGGTLNFRQGPGWPPDLGVTIQLAARQGEDLAGQTVRVEATRTNAARITLRWKDKQGQALNQVVRAGYALRIQFGNVTSGQLPGTLYLCLPDEQRSWIAGSFSAEIRRPTPPKPAAR